MSDGRIVGGAAVAALLLFSQAAFAQPEEEGRDGSGWRILREDLVEAPLGEVWPRVTAVLREGPMWIRWSDPALGGIVGGGQWLSAEDFAAFARCPSVPRRETAYHYVDFTLDLMPEDPFRRIDEPVDRPDRTRIVYYRLDFFQILQDNRLRERRIECRGTGAFEREILAAAMPERVGG